MENLVISTRKKFTMDKMFSQVKLVAENPIKNVLNVAINAAVSTSECSGGAVSISGKITATMLYVSTDNQIEKATGSVEFIEKQRAEFDLFDVFAKSDAIVDGVNFSSNEAMISVSHTAQIEGVYNYEIPQIDAEKDNLVLKSSTFTASNVKCSVADTFAVAEDYQTSFEELEVLSARAGVVQTSVNAGIDKIVIDGKVLTEVVFLAEDTLQKQVKEFEFKQEIAASGADLNNIAEAVLDVQNCEVTAQLNSGKVALAYVIQIAARGFVYEETTFEVVKDLYSLTSEIVSTKTYLETKNYKLENVLSDNFSSVVDISEIEGLDDVIAVLGGAVTVKNVTFSENEDVIECSQAVNVLYKTENGTLSMQKELEFTIQAKPVENSNLAGVVVAGEVSSFKVKAGRDIEIISRYTAALKYEDATSEDYTSGYEVIGEKSENKNGIKVYVAKEGQSVFEIAKILNVTPETICEQNEIDEVFEAGQKIYVYSPVNLV